MTSPKWNKPPPGAPSERPQPGSDGEQQLSGYWYTAGTAVLKVRLLSGETGYNISGSLRQPPVRGRWPDHSTVSGTSRSRFFRIVASFFHGGPLPSPQS